MAVIVTSLPRRLSARRTAYAAQTEPFLVDVPELPFLVLEGSSVDDPGLDGRPGSPADALLRTSRAVRFVLERGPTRLRSTPPAPLELVRWSPPTAPTTGTGRWLLLVAQPDAVDDTVLELARTRVRETVSPVHADAMTLTRHREGLVAQVLHQGPVETVDARLPPLLEFIADRGLVPRRRRHVILLRRRPGRPATHGPRIILRQPVRVTTSGMHGRPLR